MNLLDMLENHVPTDEQERRSRDRALQFIHTHREAFDERAHKKHITVSALVLNQDKTKFLLMRMTQESPWQPVTAHCKGNREILDVVTHSVGVETGIINVEPITALLCDVDVVTSQASVFDVAHRHYDMRYILHAATESPPRPPISNRARQFRWFSFDEALPPLDHGIMRFIDKCKELAGYVETPKKVVPAEKANTPPLRRFIPAPPQNFDEQEPSA